jgi:retron-type reverse transcriptase
VSPLWKAIGKLIKKKKNKEKREREREKEKERKKGKRKKERPSLCNDLAKLILGMNPKDCRSTCRSNSCNPHLPQHYSLLLHCGISNDAHHQ